MKATAPNLRFREARKRMGLSPEEVAERSGVVQADVYRFAELFNLTGTIVSRGEDDRSLSDPRRRCVFEPLGVRRILRLMEVPGRVSPW